jgi:hypothetical protein
VCVFLRSQIDRDPNEADSLTEPVHSILYNK